MSNILILNVPRVDVGLQTATYTVPTGGAGLYNIAAQITEIPPSGLSVVVNKNASPVYTAPTITPTQSALQFKTSLPLADADVVTVVLSSSQPNDKLLNSVKSNLALGQGE
jgi:hypothetical protein